MIEHITMESLSSGERIEIGMDGYQEYWLERVDWGQATGSHNTYSLFNQVGESIVSTSLPPRSLSVTGWVVDDSTPLRTRCSFLNRFISPMSDYLLKFEKYQIGFRPDASVIYGREYTVNNIKMRQFLIQATCPQPVFSETIEQRVPFDFSTKRFRFPTDFGQTAPILFALTEKVYNTKIHNPGGFSVGVTIDIAFIGNVTNPGVRDLRTNKFIGVDKSFVSGDRITIVTIPGKKSMTVKHQDDSVENLIKYRNVQTSWLQLAPGNNTWALECSNLEERANMQVHVLFHPVHLEVE